MDDKTYEDRVIRLHELLEPMRAPRLEGFTFRRCHIEGPAVVLLQGAGSVRECRFDAPNADSMLFEIPEGPRVGVIAMLDCHMIECQLTEIGFAGSPEALAPFRESPFS